MMSKKERVRMVVMAKVSKPRMKSSEPYDDRDVLVTHGLERILTEPLSGDSVESTGGAMKTLVIFSVVWTLLTHAALADVFQYVDAAGVTHFSDHPKDVRYQRISSDPSPTAKSGTREQDPPLYTVARVPAPVVPRPASVKAAVLTKKRNSAGMRTAMDQMIEREAENQGMEPALVKAVVHAESAFNTQAISAAGAMGLMQIMPQTASELGLKNPFNPQENVRGGIRYLRTLLQFFNNDLSLALAAYNAGLGKVLHYGKVPPFKETQRYVGKVIQFYKMYAQAGLPKIFKVTRTSGEVVYTNHPGAYAQTTASLLPVQF